jgi:hypothetical protein
VRDGRLVDRGELGMLRLVSPSVSGDGQLLVNSWLDTTSSEMGVRLFSLKEKREVDRFSESQAAFANLALSSDGSIIAIATQTSVRLLDRSSRQLIRTLKWPDAVSGQVPQSTLLPSRISITFSPDHAHLIGAIRLAHGAHSLILWNLDEGRVPNRGKDSRSYGCPCQRTTNGDPATQRRELLFRSQ